MYSCPPEQLVSNHNAAIGWSRRDDPIYAYLFWGAEYWLLSSEKDAISGLPAWAVELAFEHADLMAKGQDLGLEPKFGLVARKDGIEEEADDRVEEGQGHGGGAWQVVRVGSPLIWIADDPTELV